MADTPQDTASKASIVQLAQYVVAVDGTKVCEEDGARAAFARVQHIASHILGDALNAYPFPPAPTPSE